MTTDSRLTAAERAEAGPSESLAVSSSVNFKKILIGILFLAIFLRVASALYQGNTVVPLPGIHDQTSYHALAVRVADGFGFSFGTGHWPATAAGEPTAHWSYLYTLYLAGIYKIFGVQPIIARLLQALTAGVLHVWFAWRIGRRVFGPTTGLIAAGLSAVYVYFFYYAGGLLTETYYIIGILWTFDVSLRLSANARQRVGDETPSKYYWRLWLELGLAIGVTVLLRQVFLLFVPFLFVWLWWNVLEQNKVSSGHLRRLAIDRWPTLKGLIGATLLVILLIVPWSVRNYQAFDTFVPLNTNAGFAFYWGNHPIHGTNFIPLLPINGPSYQDLIPEELLHLNEAEMDRALLKESIGIISNDPIRILLLSLSRTVEYFKFWPSPQSSPISNISRVASFGILMPFMLYGLWISARLIGEPRRQGQAAEIILFYLFIVVYSGVHLLTWTLIRYRLPVDTILLIFAAYGLADIAGHLNLPQTVRLLHANRN